MIGLLLVAAAGTGTTIDRPVDPRIAALAVHLERHPEAGAADVYKFLHQGVFGPGHMIPDRTAAGRFLDAEIETLEPVDRDEPLCEGLGGSPAMVRIHLRPFREAGFDVEVLIGLFVQSANQITGDPEVMNRALLDATRWLESVEQTGLADELEILRREYEPQGFPALHHSDRFRTAHDPAYRVVLRDLAGDHGWCE